METPLEIFYFEKDALKLNEANLKKLVDNPKLKDKKVFFFTSLFLINLN